jgi:hypothetical protein
MIKTMQETMNVRAQMNLSKSQITVLHRSKALIPRRGLDS